MAVQERSAHTREAPAGEAVVVGLVLALVTITGFVVIWEIAPVLLRTALAGTALMGLGLVSLTVTARRG
jgi:hypothetical protein